MFYSVSCLKEGKAGKIVFSGKQQMVHLCSRTGRLQSSCWQNMLGLNTNNDCRCSRDVYFENPTFMSVLIFYETGSVREKCPLLFL